MSVVIGMAVIMSVQVLIELIRLPRCRSCEPRCPASMTLGVAAAIGMLVQ